MDTEQLKRIADILEEILRIIKFKNMEKANDELPLGDGAWFGPDEGQPANTYKWEKGNFFD